MCRHAMKISFEDPCSFVIGGVDSVDRIILTLLVFSDDGF